MLLKEFLFFLTDACGCGICPESEVSRFFSRTTPVLAAIAQPFVLRTWCAATLWLSSIHAGYSTITFTAIVTIEPRLGATVILCCLPHVARRPLVPCCALTRVRVVLVVQIR